MSASIQWRMAALALCASAILVSAPVAAQAPARSSSTDARVEALLRRMTLEEKVGQMTQLTVQAVARTRGTATVAQELDSAKLADALIAHNVGSLLNVWDAALTPQQWQELIATAHRFTDRTRLKIPIVYGIDAVHGQHYMRGSTIFPHNLAMAATFNPELVRREHRITAFETRAGGIAGNFAPVLDLGRQPLWPRFYETFGEDVYLASVLGRVAVVAEQTDSLHPGRVFVAATGKHF